MKNTDIRPNNIGETQSKWPPCAMAINSPCHISSGAAAQIAIHNANTAAEIGRSICISSCEGALSDFVLSISSIPAELGYSNIDTFAADVVSGRGFPSSVRFRDDTQQLIEDRRPAQRGVRAGIERRGDFHD